MYVMTGGSFQIIEGSWSHDHVALHYSTAQCDLRQQT